MKETTANEKPAEKDPLEFLGPRLRELLKRCAEADRRDELQEVAYLIEARAGINREVPLAGLPVVLQPTATRIREISSQAAHTDSAPRSGGSV